MTLKITNINAMYKTVILLRWWSLITKIILQHLRPWLNNIHENLSTGQISLKTKCNDYKSEKSLSMTNF